MHTLEDIDVTGKKILVRVDLNVPMKNGRIEDATRVKRVIPTLQNLVERKAKVIIISHFGRPKGEFVRDMSLVPLADALGEAMGGIQVKFAIDCIDHHAREAVDELNDGEILLLENLRFHKGEEKNDPDFVDALAKLGDIYVNDTFSCSHREHASIVGVAKKLPSAAGLLLQEEIESLNEVLNPAKLPMAAIVGGSKVSTKLGLLNTLIKKVDLLAIGGAMANSFLVAKGFNVGKSLYEKDLVEDAKRIIDNAEKEGCEIFLPKDVIVAKKLEERATCQVVYAEDVPDDSMILDLGPETISSLAKVLSSRKTIVWNGPLGAFEYRPFDVSSISLAQNIAKLTNQKGIISVAGGGDVVAALGVSGLTESFSYISTAGGAFLDWLQGEELPGVKALS